MRYLLYYTSVLILVFLPVKVFSASETSCFLVSGFDPEAANGLYYYNGLYNNSEPVFEYPTEGWYLASSALDSGYWNLRSSMIDIDTEYNSQFYNDDSYTSSPSGHSWAYQEEYGGYGAGTVSEVACEEEATTTSSTTTSEVLLGTLNFGIAIIIAILSLFSITFIYNQMTSKKPWQK